MIRLSILVVYDFKTHRIDPEYQWHYKNDNILNI